MTFCFDGEGVEFDKFKKYASDDLNNSDESKKILSIMNHNIKLLGVFFSQCLEMYSTKN